MGIDRCPHRFGVDPEVFVHQDVAHTDDLLPGRFALPTKLWREACYGLTQSREVVHDPDLDQFVTLERLTPLRAVLLELLDRIQDVAQTLDVAAHKGVASRSTRSRMRGFSIAGVITSTRHCR